MSAGRSFAWGQCTSCQSKKAFASQLREQGLNVFVRSHSLNILDCENFTFEFDSNTEDDASIEGTAASFSVLEKDVQVVSTALSAAGVRFWLEVTDSVQNRLAYFHNQWPEE